MAAAARGPALRGNFVRAPPPKTADQRLQEVVRSPAFQVLVDTVVVANVLVVGLDLDVGDSAPTLFEIMRHVVVGLYVVEMSMRLATEGRAFFTLWPLSAARPMNIYDFVIVTLAVVDIWILRRVTWLWRVSIARSVRLLRIYRVAQHFPVLHDLWLVLTGLARAGKSLVWLGLLVAGVLFSCGGAFRGLLGTVEAQVCEGGPGMDCIDQHEFFGSVSRAALTLLQLATLDNWASHVVRPLMNTSPGQALLLVAFVLATAYALLSVAVGLLVYSTVSLARSHEAHADHAHKQEAQTHIKFMVKYLNTSLLIADRTTIDLKEMSDAMSNPKFFQAFKELELPVESANELFKHLDGNEAGEISMHAFETGLLKMKSSSSRFDVAILTATVGGAAGFVCDMEGRTDGVLQDLRRARGSLQDAFSDLRALALREVEHSPEVRLRAEGRIYNSAEDFNPVQKPRYTG